MLNIPEPVPYGFPILETRLGQGFASENVSGNSACMGEPSYGGVPQTYIYQAYFLQMKGERRDLASFPDHSQISSCSHGEGLGTRLGETEGTAYQLILRCSRAVLSRRCRQSHSIPVSVMLCLLRWSSWRVVFT